MPSLTTYAFRSENFLKYKTLITQEMLKKNILASNAFYVSYSHSYQIIDEYIKNLEGIFNQIKECEDGKFDIDNLLDSGCCHNGFTRLN